MVIPYPRGSVNCPVRASSTHQVPWDVWINSGGYTDTGSEANFSEKDDHDIISYFGHDDSESSSSEEEDVEIDQDNDDDNAIQDHDSPPSDADHNNSSSEDDSQDDSQPNYSSFNHVEQERYMNSSDATMVIGYNGRRRVTTAPRGGGGRVLPNINNQNENDDDDLIDVDQATSEEWDIHSFVEDLYRREVGIFESNEESSEDDDSENDDLDIPANMYSTFLSNTNQSNNYNNNPLINRTNNNSGVNSLNRHIPRSTIDPNAFPSDFFMGNMSNGNNYQGMASCTDHSDISSDENNSDSEDINNSSSDDDSDQEIATANNNINLRRHDPSDVSNDRANRIPQSNGQHHLGLNILLSQDPSANRNSLDSNGNWRPNPLSSEFYPSRQSNRAQNYPRNNPGQRHRPTNNTSNTENCNLTDLLLNSEMYHSLSDRQRHFYYRTNNHRHPNKMNKLEMIGR